MYRESPLFVWFIYIYIYIEKQEYLIYINESKENKDYKDIFSPRHNLKNRNLQGLAFGPSYILIKTNSSSLCFLLTI